MTTAVPAVTPVTTPAPVPTLALALLLLQVPPVVVSVKVVVRPVHTFKVPVIFAGGGFILKVVVAMDGEPQYYTE